MDGVDNGFIPQHGGYRNLVVYKITEIIYDFTFRFCNKYVKNQGRTYDQMVQATRSGMQNIAEGSVDSGVSKASELKLTGIAKGIEGRLHFLLAPAWISTMGARMRFCAGIGTVALFFRTGSYSLGWPS